MKVRAIDETHNEKSVSRRFAARIEKVLKGLNSYMDIVQTMVQHSPEISSLVVGGVMFILNVWCDWVMIVKLIANSATVGDSICGILR